MTHALSTSRSQALLGNARLEAPLRAAAAPKQSFGTWVPKRSLGTSVILALLVTASRADDSAWPKIEKYFQPPAEFAKDFGPYRSPLKL